MKHKDCGGVLILDDDAYRCTICHVGYKCVGHEKYLDQIVELEAGQWTA